VERDDFMEPPPSYNWYKGKINNIRVFQKPSINNGIRHVFSSRNDGICEINETEANLVLSNKKLI